MRKTVAATVASLALLLGSGPVQAKPLLPPPACSSVKPRNHGVPCRETFRIAFRGVPGGKEFTHVGTFTTIKGAPLSISVVREPHHLFVDILNGDKVEFTSSTKATPRVTTERGTMGGGRIDERRVARWPSRDFIFNALA